MSSGIPFSFQGSSVDGAAMRSSSSRLRRTRAGATRRDRYAKVPIRGALPREARPGPPEGLPSCSSLILYTSAQAACILDRRLRARSEQCRFVGYVRSRRAQDPDARHGACVGKGRMTTRISVGDTGARGRSMSMRAAIGALAGLTATVPMSVALEVMRQRLPPRERGSLPPRKIAMRAARRVGLRVHTDKRQRDLVTLVTHFGFGAAAGTLYVPLASRLGSLPPVLRGMGFGVAVWLADDQPRPARPTARCG